MNTNSDKYIPPIEMRHFVQALLSEQVKGNKTEAERRTGVSRGRFYYYFEKPEFRKWFSGQCDLIFGRNEAIPPYALMNAIIQGDVQAIRTFYELRGKLKHQLEHSGKIEGPEHRITNIILNLKPEELNDYYRNRTSVRQTNG